MRIGINTLFFIPGEVGGSETYLCGTLGAMLSEEPGNTYVLFTNRENHDALRARFGEHPSVHLCSLQFGATNRCVRIVREQAQLPFVARRWELDLLWSPGYTAPLRAPCLQVLSVLDMQYKTHPQDLSVAARWATGALIQGGVRAASRVIAISEFSKTEITRYTGIPAEMIDVTPLAVDADFARTPRSGPPAAPRPYILCVAHSHPHKNLHALVSAYASIQPLIPHHLLLVGKPRRGEPALLASMEKVPDPTRITRLGGLEQEALIGAYRGASLFVFPSLYEGFGLPVLEAMLAGIPVLTTRKGSLPEVGADTVAYFDPDRETDLAEQIMRTLSEANASRVARAAARAETFTWERTAALTLASFRRAIRPPGDGLHFAVGAAAPP